MVVSRSSDVCDPEAAESTRARFWRSLEEWGGGEEWRESLHNEFLAGASVWSDEPSRRRFLQLMGASLALAGLAGCRSQPPEKVVPYVAQPEQFIPGRPLYYATAMTHGGAGVGLLVESHMGRPTKVEGNPRHPACPSAIDESRRARLDEQQRHMEPGASDIFAQAAVLTLYDPDRSQTVRAGEEITTWNAFLTDLRPRLDALRKRGGAGLRILSETVVSPTLAAQWDELAARFPEARWHQYEPVNRDRAREGAILAFGEDVVPVYDFGKADVVLSLDADFLTTGPGHLRYAREFMQRRNVAAAGSSLAMNRLYVVESTPSCTGAKADHRLALTSRQIEALARALAAKLGVDVAAPEPELLAGVPGGWVDAVVEDLRSYRLAEAEGHAAQRESRATAGSAGASPSRGTPSHSLVLAGPWQSPLVHVLAHAMNERLGNVGRTVSYTAPVEARPVNQTESLRELVEDMRAGRVEVLLILSGNPVFTAPADFGFAEALDKVPYRAHLGLYYDETGERCQWHVPETHFLEAWSDTRAYDGTASIVQPLIAPLYDGHAAHEVLSALLDQSGVPTREVVRAHWRKQHGAEGFEAWWQAALHEGVVAETKSEGRVVEVVPDFAGRARLLPSRNGHAGSAGASPSRGSPSRVEIVFRPDPTIWDGRFANNGWLQELPKPFTKLTWDNAALVSPTLAARLGLQSRDLVDLQHDGRTLRLPVWILPGQADDCVTVHFGYGRTRAGETGTGTGFNAYSLRTSAAPWFADGALVKAEGQYPLVSTQEHQLVEGRELIRAGLLAELVEQPQQPAFMASHDPPHEETFYQPPASEGYKWGMSINLGTCIGCNACVAACQAENNIPVVGKEQVAHGRAMHWIRVDTYFEGDPQAPAAHFQPVPCMHCELAPCEPVCPVAATTHSSEGLNEMTYNRCVGTRYCSNNCPYKVRRFNFLHFTLPVEQHPSLKLLQNPDVTVRARGVMEKCTYCVQRITQARIEAEKQDRRIRDGELLTACQAACPTAAIVFGDLNDPDSLVRRLKDRQQNPLDYALLGELNTRPRTTYSAEVKNPHPKLGMRAEG